MTEEFAVHCTDTVEKVMSCRVFDTRAEADAYILELKRDPIRYTKVYLTAPGEKPNRMALEDL